MSSKPAKKAKKAETPKDEYFARLEKACEAHKAEGTMLVRGIPRHDDSDEDDNSDDESDDERTEPQLTAEQVASLRHILITKSRDQALEAGHSFASCGQSDDDCPIATFNTGTGNQVVFGIRGEVQKALKKKGGSAQFDALFGLTHGLQSYDSWMHDNECWEKGGELQKAIAALGKAWKDLLKKSDAELGIDAEFTRPGIESLLAQLQGTFKECEVTEKFAFKWCA